MSSGLALGLVASLVFATAALADTEVGSVGPYQWPDATGAAGAICKYRRDSADPNIWWLTSIAVKPPTMYWPNYSLESDSEHGPVSWQFFVEYQDLADGGLGPKSTVQRATAYEATSAPFTRMSVAIDGAAMPFASWEVVQKATRYKKNGSVAGYALHQMNFYAVKLGKQAPFEPQEMGCRSRFDTEL